MTLVSSAPKKTQAYISLLNASFLQAVVDDLRQQLKNQETEQNALDTQRQMIAQEILERHQNTYTLLIAAGRSEAVGYAQIGERTGNYAARETLKKQRGFTKEQYAAIVDAYSYMDQYSTSETQKGMLAILLQEASNNKDFKGALEDHEYVMSTQSLFFLREGVTNSQPPQAPHRRP